MLSLLPRSMLRPCSWCARQRYVGASRISNSSVSMGRPLKACATRLAPSRPTGATTFTGRIKLAASAQYTAEPPSVSSTLPKGPSRVSSATEPATRSCGGGSGTAACTAARVDDVMRGTQLHQEVGRIAVVVDLHPASAQLSNRVRVRSGGCDLAQVCRQPGGCRIRGRVAPRIVGLDDVDPVCQLHDPFGTEMRPMPVEWMWQVGQSPHLVNQVHDLFGRQEGSQAVRDEQSNDLALARLCLFADDGQLRGDLRQLESAFDCVVVGERNAVEPALSRAFDQRMERALTVVRKDRVQVKVDPEQSAYSVAAASLSMRSRALAKSGMTSPGPRLRQACSMSAAWAS